MQDGEPDILLKVITMAHDKIWSVLEKLSNPEIHTCVQQMISSIEGDDTFLEDMEKFTFRRWISKLPSLVSLKPSTTPTQLMPYLKWASEARWIYAERIEELFDQEDKEPPLWIKHIYKLARYFSATKAMVKLATKMPGLFASIYVEALQAPKTERFSLERDNTALRKTLERLTKAAPEPLVEKLGQLWLTDDPDARFWKACRLELTVHAEMQLLAFYDHNPDLTPRLLFMGTSKKACYLCHEFLSRHPLTIGVSACHQKLYPTWMPAPCSSTVRKKHKSILWELSRHLEEATIRDLETRLGVRRPMHMDSTAGPSLTTTGTVSSGLSILRLPIRPQPMDDQDLS